MKISKLTRSSIGKMGVLTSVATTFVTVACGGGDAQRGTQERAKAEAVAKTEAAITGASCQALDVAAHERTTYAVKLNGEVWGWGANGPPDFPLGYNSLDPKYPLGTTVTTPHYLGVTNAKKVAATAHGACALLGDGTVSCWGLPLGADRPAAGAAPPPPSLVQVAQANGALVTLSGAIGLAAGDAHACVWKADGTAWCWGDDSLGQLGDGADPNGNVGSSIATAVQMLGVTDVVSVAAGGSTTCVLRKVGVIECVGSNSAGQLGEGAAGATLPDGGAVQQGNLVPVTVPSTLRFSALYGGGHGTFCGTGTPPDGGAGETTYCWGINGQGQAVIANTNGANSPSAISTDVGSTWAQGDSNACEVSASGAVSCWGMNTYGQIPGASSATTNDILVSTPVTGVSGAMKVAIGKEHLCSLSTGALTCWGNDADGEIGNGATAGATAPYNLHLSELPPVCPAWNGCGTVTNKCGEAINCGDCGGRVETGDQLCVSNQCVSNPNYCEGGCGAGEFCQNRACVAYCGTNPITSSSVGAVIDDSSSLPTGQGVQSPATYGSTGCDDFIADVRVTNTWERNIYALVWPNPSQADCPNTRVTVATYVNGAPATAPTTVVGVWNPGGCGGYNGPCFNTPRCEFNGGLSVPLPYPMPASYRFAAKAERATIAKGTQLWGATIPVEIIVGPMPPR